MVKFWGGAGRTARRAAINSSEITGQEVGYIQLKLQTLRGHYPSGKLIRRSARLLSMRPCQVHPLR